MTKYRLDQIGKVIGGGTPSTRKKQYYANKGIAWITPKDLSGYSKMYISHGARDISQEGLDNSSAKLLPKDTVLVSSRAPIGYVALAANKITTNQGFKSIVPNTDIVLPKYLYYLMLTKKDELENVSSGSTFKEVSGRVMKGFEVDIPSLDKQANIIQKIEPITRKIELNYQINANLQKLASTYFQFFLKKIETTNVLLEEVANIKSGGDKPKDITSKKDSDHLIPIFSNGMTNEGLYGYTKIAKIKEKAITVSARGTIGYTCLRTEPYFPIVRLISVIPYPKISVYYLYLWLLNTDIQGFGTTQQQLTVPVFKKYSVSIPKDLKDMSFFDNHVSVFFEQIQKNKEETKLLKEIKESLLKKLF